MDFIHDDVDVVDKMVTFFSLVKSTGQSNNVKTKHLCRGCSWGPASHRVLSLQLELVDGQSFGVLQLLDLLHLLIVASDLLVDDHLHTPGAEPKVLVSRFIHATNFQRCCIVSVVLRGCFGDVLHAEQRVGAVWAAKDARGEHYGQRVGRHAVVGLVFTHPGKDHWMWASLFSFYR